MYKVLVKIRKNVNCIDEFITLRNNNGDRKKKMHVYFFKPISKRLKQENIRTSSEGNLFWSINFALNVK